MKFSLAVKSIIVFGSSVIFLFALTLFESFLLSLSMTAERIISALLLVIPGIIGVILGILSLRHKESKPWLAGLGIVLNALFALFHILLLSFAG